MKPISDTYYKTIANIPLLTREQEVELAKDVAGKNVKKAKKAVDTLVVSNLRLASTIVAKSYGYHSDQEDLMSAATIGLIKAAQHYKPDKGAKFSTYAAFWIRQQILDYIETSSIIRLTSHAHGMNSKISNVTEQIRNEIGHTPSNSEISEITGISIKKLEEYSGYKYSMIPIDSPAYANGEAEGATLADTLEDYNAVRPDKATQNSNDGYEVGLLLDSLNEREKMILTDRYGLNGEEPLVLEDIGKKLKITRERVRQIQERALYKIRKTLVRKENSLEGSSVLM